MPVIHFPEQLLFYVGDQTKVSLPAANLREALTQAVRAFPLLKDEMLAVGLDRLRSSVRVIVDGSLVSDSPLVALENIEVESQTKIEVIVLSNGG